MTVEDTGCCPRFDPAPWQEKEVVWQDKRFVKDRVRSFLHISLNFGSVMKRNMQAIEAACGRQDDTIVLCDEGSLWGSDVYISVPKDVPGAQMTTLSGTFLSKVFEGPYRNVGLWMREMGEYVKSKGRTQRKLYCYYTTCPNCAKAYGKNYVVLLAQV